MGPSLSCRFKGYAGNLRNLIGWFRGLENKGRWIFTENQNSGLVLLLNAQMFKKNIFLWDWRIKKFHVVFGSILTIPQIHCMVWIIQKKILPRLDNCVLRGLNFCKLSISSNFFNTLELKSVDHFYTIFVIIEKISKIVNTANLLLLYRWKLSLSSKYKSSPGVDRYSWRVFRAHQVKKK